MIINILKSNDLFTYHQVQNSKILHDARLALNNLHVSQLKQRLYTSMIGWFL